MGQRNEVLHIEKKIAIKTDRFDKFAKYWQKWM